MSKPLPKGTPNQDRMQRKKDATKARVKKKKITKSIYRNKSDDNIENTLWRWFSLFIRLRDSTHNGYGNCITCNKTIYYKDGHAGHYLSRRFKNIKYDERNVSLQCVRCNSFENGRQDVYKDNIDAKFGKGTAQELEKIKNVLVKIDRNYIIARLTVYKIKVNELKKGITERF